MTTCEQGGDPIFACEARRDTTSATWSLVGSIGDSDAMTDGVDWSTSSDGDEVRVYAHNGRVWVVVSCPPCDHAVGDMPPTEARAMAAALLAAADEAERSER
jgi:hypothetical protein